MKRRKKYRGKRVVIIILMAMFLMPQAESLGVSPDSLITRANLYYANGMYEDAARLYQQVADTGYAAAELYYNLGNAYFKAHDIPRAILYYERAHLLDPGNEDINYNLDLARTYVTDKIDVLPRFFLVAWYHWFLDRLPADGWALFSMITFFLGLLFLSLYVVAARKSLKKTGFIAGVVILAFSALSFLFAWQSRNILTAHDHAIVMSPAVTVKSSPGEDGTDLFVIHEGMKVAVEDSLDHWTEIRLEDGSKGWLPEEAITKI
jgi:tetratricopeptide (TPR) repeat protein